MSEFLSPPYDIVTPELKRDLLESTPENIASVDLPLCPLSLGASMEPYRRSRESLEAMVRSGRLVRVSAEALFVSRQSFREDDGSYHRRLSLMASVPLVQPGTRPRNSDDSILDHELTNPQRLADRLALLEALRVQSSPVFGLYSDQHGAVEDMLRTVQGGRPPTHAGTTPDGTLHELWPVIDHSEQEALIGVFGSRRLIIADGHNRYFAALEYWRALCDAGSVSSDDPDHPASRCFFALVAHQDPGLRIRSIHRAVGGMTKYSVAGVIEASRGVFDVARVDCPPEGLLSAVAKARFESSHAMGLYDLESDNCYVLTTSELDPMAPFFPEKPPRWRHLDTVVCDHLLIERVLSNLEGVLPHRSTFHTISQLRSLRRSSKPPQAAILLLPLRLSDIAAICELGELMPPESTLFWPKVATGLVLSALE